MQALRNIGKLVAVFGLKGDLVLRHHLGKKTALRGLSCIFLEEKKEEWLPHFVESTRAKNDQEVYLKLEEIHTKEQAAGFLFKEVWIREDDFSKYARKSAPISLVGYRISDKGKDLGEVLEVMEQTHQTLCRLVIGGREVLIPLTPEFILTINQKKKVVNMDLPEGLLDIYLL